MKDLHRVKVIRHHREQILLREVIRAHPLQGQAEAVVKVLLAVQEVAMFQVVAAQDHPDQVQVAAHPVLLPEVEVEAQEEDSN
jgi:hypothetical protein